MVEGWIIDAVQGKRLIEVQTGHFSSIRTKLFHLIDNYHVTLVYPIAYEKWIVKLPENQFAHQERRKSPKRGTIFQVFNELVSFPQLIQHPNFSLEVPIIQEEEVRKFSREKTWRQYGWARVERRLIQVLETVRFSSPNDFVALLPSSLPGEFITADLSLQLHIPRYLAQKMIYCLCQMSAIEVIGKKGRFLLYKRSC